MRIVAEWSPEMMNSIGSTQELIDWLVGEDFRFWRVGGAAAVEPVAVSIWRITRIATCSFRVRIRPLSDAWRQRMAVIVLRGLFR